MHAANLVKVIQDRPDNTIRFSAMGGAALRQRDVDILVNNEAIAVMGLVEVIKHYPAIRRALKTMQQAVLNNKPDLLILVDYVEFNLKLAETAKQAGVKVLFYVSPQVWAWRPKRVKRIGRLVDMMAVIFPFETKFYEQHQIPVRYVGNPLTGHVRAERSLAACMTAYNLDSAKPVIGLFPGSRKSEIKMLLPVFLQAAELIQREVPDLQFLLPLAPGLTTDDLQPWLADGPDNIQLVTDGKPYDVMQCCQAILTASGTATLETALMEIPMAIAYRTSPVTYAIFSRLIRIPDIGLANIVAEKRIVQEFLQNQATPEALAAEMLRLLQDQDYRQQILKEYKIVKEKLGDKNGSENVAALALEMLEPV